MRDRRRRRDREEKGTRCSSQDTKGTKTEAGKQNVWIIEGRDSGLYREDNTGKGSPGPGLES